MFSQVINKPRNEITEIHVLTLNPIGKHFSACLGSKSTQVNHISTEHEGKCGRFHT